MAGLNETPSGERVHIGFFGVRNAGKSSLVNAVTNQDLAVVSNVAGTTTDPVRKAMELLPLGPVLVIDTPGIDDTGDLGGLRVQKALRTLDSVDVAVLVVDSTKGLTPADRELIGAFEQKNTPYVVAWSKCDLHACDDVERMLVADEGGEGPGHSQVLTSSATGEGVDALKAALASVRRNAAPQKQLVGDLLEPGDVVVLVIPIDSAAPKGRLILPQQQVIRDCLDAGAQACVTSVQALPDMLRSLNRNPRLVITDSQVFGAVASAVPETVPLTSFSILMARYKGTLPAQVAAVDALESLGDGDVVLISEGCTHHRQCEDIGTVKLPRWIRDISKADVSFAFTSGGEFPGDLKAYKAVVHCGGCMLNAREMQHRAGVARANGVPFTNYGMVIAKAHGVLERSLAPFAGS